MSAATSIVSRLSLALSALILAGGGVVHGLAFPKASNVVAHSDLKPLFAAVFNGLWLSDSATSIALALGLCGLFCRKRRRLQMFLLTIAGVSAMGLLNGCGESPKSGETSAVMVTATSGTLQHATRLLVVAQ